MWAILWRSIQCTQVIVVVNLTTLIFLVKVMEQHLDRLRWSLLSVQYVLNLSRSCWNKTQSCSFWTPRKILRSSANSRNLQLWKHVFMSFINKIKIKGPRIEPWGTPEDTKMVLDSKPFTTTLWVLLNIYDANQRRRSPLIPLYDNFCKRSLWSTLSKAFRKSVYTEST